MIKTLSKEDVEGAFLNKIKAIYERPTANIILNGQKLKSVPLRSETKMSSLITPIQNGIGSPSHSITQEKKKASKLERRKQNSHCLQMTR